MTSIPYFTLDAALLNSQDASKLILVRKLLNNNESIKSLENNIGLLINLEHLDISINQLGALPLKLFSLKNLKYLDIGVNDLRSICPEISGLHNLEHLFLKQNLLLSLPDEICELTKLKTLSIGGGNPIRSLPLALHRLTSLEKLSFLGNEHLEKHESFRLITTLQNLSELDIGICGIEGLIDEVKNLKNLKSLKFSLKDGQNLAKIIEALNQLYSLEKVELEINTETFPNDLSSLKIKQLAISYTGNTSLEEIIRCLNTNLEGLILKGINTDSLPKNLKNFHHLQSLSIENNLHFELNKANLSILAGLPELINLNLINCNLTNLEGLNLLKSLTSLNLSKNYNLNPDTISEIESLKKLDLSECNITSLPQNMDNLIALKLNRHPQIKNSNVLSSIGNYPNLHELHLEKCKLKKVPLEITNIKSLSFFNLRNNPFNDDENNISTLLEKNVKLEF